MTCRAFASIRHSRCACAFLGSVAGSFSAGIHRWIFYNKDPRISCLPLSSTPESLSAAREALSLIPPDAAVSASHLLANHLAKRRILYYNREPEEFSEKTIEFFQENCGAIYQKDRIVVLKRKTPPMSLEEYRQKRKQEPQTERN